MQYTHNGNLRINMQMGFTLIELLIVMAIIGILSVVAVPSYQNNVTKAQLTRTYYELKAATTAIDTIIVTGNVPTINRSLDGKPVNGKFYEFIGLDSNHIDSNILSEVHIVSDANTVKGLSATLGNNVSTAISGTIINLERSESGTWTCRIEPHGSNAKNYSRYAISNCSITTN
jgi:type IV pilus assembly protein PilA